MIDPRQTLSQLSTTGLAVLMLVVVELGGERLGRRQREDMQLVAFRRFMADPCEFVACWEIAQGQLRARVCA